MGLYFSKAVKDLKDLVIRFGLLDKDGQHTIEIAKYHQYQLFNSTIMKKMLLFFKRLITGRTLLDIDPRN